MTKEQTNRWEEEFYQKWKEQAELAKSGVGNIGGFRLNGVIDKILVCQFFQKVISQEKEKWVEEIYKMEIEEYQSPTYIRDQIIDLLQK